MSDIKVCTEQETGVPADIVICDETDTQAPEDIKVCTDDGRYSDSGCVGLQPLTLSGDGDCNVGDVYVASGGSGVYTFSFTGGSISSSGEILTINACGAPGTSRAASVTVNDGCSETRLEVRLPSGVWVSNYIVFGTISFTCSSTNNCSGVSPPLDVGQTTDIGGVRWIDTWNGLQGFAEACTGYAFAPCVEYTMSLNAHATPPIAFPSYIRKQERQDWLCP